MELVEKLQIIGKEIGKVNMMHNGGPGYILLKYKNLIPEKTNFWNIFSPLTSRGVIKKKGQKDKKRI